ncbi:hypothetical protein [Oricola cellulosilytica]|uniref:Uncharacterized protein n=1 Tax=Oricola cellulosilytica TaxID=1429082 RepID=A0A4V2MP47_9HYPH|nr:hypothetical protein [Oricola cellulosilytica]TCD16232.1 hypothetical protein E0D97_02025 [Oricola cellulosilytica]
MSVVRYAVVGVTACIAALTGVTGHALVSQPGSNDAARKEVPASEMNGIKFPPVPVAVYTRKGRIGYCVMRVEYYRGDNPAGDDEIAQSRITTELYAEFSKVLNDAMDGPVECAERVGKRASNFKIYQAEFYDKLD